MVRCTGGSRMRACRGFVLRPWCAPSCTNFAACGVSRGTVAEACTIVRRASGLRGGLRAGPADSVCAGEDDAVVRGDVGAGFVEGAARAGRFEGEVAVA